MPAPYRNIARVVRPHGSKGEVLVAALRGLPFLLREGMTVSLTPPALHRDRFCTVDSVAMDPSGDSARVRFSCLTDMGDAEGARGCFVLALEADLDLGPLDVAFDELIGREVSDAARGTIGSITEVMETPANDVWVVSGGAFGEVLVPVIPDVVDAVPASGAIPVRLLDGLISE